LADDLDDFGKVLYVSRRKAVTSNSRMQANSLSAMGHSNPCSLTLAVGRVIVSILLYIYHKSHCT